MFRIWGMILLMFFLGSQARAEEANSLVLTGMAELRAQMQVERDREKELQLLHLEVERLKLELEKKKTMVEIGKVDGVQVNVVSRALSDDDVSISLRYVFMGAGREEAVLDVDGVELHVQVGHEVRGQVVKAISKEGVSLEGENGKRSFLRPGA